MRGGGGEGAGRAAPQGQTPRGAGVPRGHPLQLPPPRVDIFEKEEGAKPPPGAATVAAAVPGRCPARFQCHGPGCLDLRGAGGAARSLPAHRLGHLLSLLLRNQPCCGATSCEAAGNKPLPTPFLQSQRSVTFGLAWSLAGALGKYLRDQGLREL